MIYVDKIFIITFDEASPAKIAQWNEALTTIPITGPLEVFECPHAHSMQRHFRSGDDADADSLTTRELRAAAGHWKIWSTSFEAGLQSILVLEETFIPKAAHFHVLDTDESWDLMYLGREAFAGDNPVGKGLVIPGYGHGAFAYMVRRSGIQKLISSEYDKRTIAVPEFLTAIQGSHPDEVVSALYRTDLIALAPMKNLIEQQNTNGSKIGSGEPYQPVHPELFTMNEETIEAWADKYVNAQIINREFDLVCDEPVANVYSFPLFTERFCKEIIEEAEHYGHWKNYRYKDHPAIDIMLTSIGFNEVYSEILRRFLYPLFQHKYQLQEELCNKLISQNFIVRYVAEEQRHLGLHNDACDISMIVTLNTAFDGGGTFFPKFGKLIKHDMEGYASIHPGFIGYVHGARPITRGRRYILASFFFRG